MADKQISEELKEQISKLERPNIAVIGGTGVGKSSLINAVFGKELAKTGAGLPVTQEFCRYPGDEYSENVPIFIYDSAGYEAEKEKEFVEGVLNFLSNKKKEGVDKQIHLVWYVINASSGRVQEFEKKIVDNINQKGIPAIIILSQCDRAKEEEIDGIKAALEKFNLSKVYDVLKVAASPLEVKGKRICDPFGLEELVNKTVELLPDMYTDALIAAQIVDLRAKRPVVWKYISIAAGTCFAAQASPVPVGTPALIAAQTGLCMSIASVYGYREVGEFLVTIGSITAFNAFLTAAIGDLIGVLLPGAGLATAGGSASYVVVFGLTCNAVFEKLAHNNLQGSNKEEIKQYLRDSFRKEFEKYSLLRISSPEALEIMKKTFLDS
ncbi:50S ribosome-binding GTPase [Nostocaceae cyanobacterium CENA369]|uniref:50S ribosome-binding GTPase n=1 Tax=Dendronalium phyllosphericum CENA369 TaxID=1725256 RepID=A0A8J7LGS5_9NOST|nr:GTPase [Dendronalium phyllosphericum]MBH8577342.1 50S ribosome-binding GTPase [Dendronalium phyllosphericum CENA369]